MKFKKTYLFFILLFFSACSEIVGPVIVSDNAGKTGNVDTWLDRAEDIYISAKGDKADERLDDAIIIYENLLGRNDLSDDQAGRAARGFAVCYTERNINNGADILESSYAMISSFDPTKFSVDIQAAENYQAVAMSLSATLKTVLDIYYDIPKKTEGDYATISLFTVILLASEMADYFVDTKDSSASLFVVQDQVVKLAENFDGFLAAVKIFPPTLASVIAATNYSNQMVKNTNAIKTNFSKVTNFIGITAAFTTNILSTLANHEIKTANSDNFLTATINQNLGGMAEALSNVTSLFNMIDDTDSLLESPFKTNRN